MDDFFVLAILYAKEGKEQALRAGLMAVVEPSRNDAGNLRYELFAQQDDPRRFVFVEHWASAAEQERHHAESAHIQQFQASGAATVERVELFYKLERIA